MTRKKTSNHKAAKGTVIECQVLGSPENIQRLRELIEAGGLATIPITGEDGTVEHVEIDRIEMSPLSPGTTERISWRRRENEKESRGHVDGGNRKSR